MKIRTTILAAAMALATVTAIASGPAPAQAADHEPILFVHGFGGNAGRWGPTIDRFRADGWPADRLFAFTYDSGKGNAAIAEDIRSQVRSIRASTGAAKVDIVAMSMGGLNSRYYLKFLGGTGVVDDWVSMAGPNHGTDAAARFCDGRPSPACAEMEVGSPFVTNLNSGDETPGGVRYGTFWSPCDLLINPDSSVALSGATNTRVGCIGHAAFLDDATVYQRVRDFVA